MKKTKLQEIYEDKFNDNWNALLSYWKEHGHASPPHNAVWDYYNVGTFVSNVRTQFKKRTLSPEREHKLRILNFDFTPMASNNERRLKLLREYVQEFGRLPTTPENGKYKGENLLSFLASKRVAYKKGTLDENLVRELEELNERSEKLREWRHQKLKSSIDYWESRRAAKRRGQVEL